MKKFSFGMLAALLTALLMAGAAQASDQLVVYTEYDNPDNLFFYKAAFFSDGGLAYLSAMNEQDTENVHSGSTDIRCQFEVRTDNWGGWYFQNGVVSPEAEALVENWGTVPNAGLDLSPYSKLTFWARGDEGGEQVQFFCLGIGRDSQTDATQAAYPYPDSSPKQSTKYLKLNKEWTQYTIDLKGCDLSYVLGGFGWATSAAKNSGRSSIAFCLDDIVYE